MNDLVILNKHQKYYTLLRLRTLRYYDYLDKVSNILRRADKGACFGDLANKELITSLCTSKEEQLSLENDLEVLNYYQHLADNVYAIP